LFEIGREARAVVVLNDHAEGAGSGSDFAPDTAHADDAKDFLLGVVAELWGWDSPFRGSDCGVWNVDAAEGAEEEEDGDVCCGGVDGARGMGYLDI